MEEGRDSWRRLLSDETLRSDYRLMFVVDEAEDPLPEDLETIAGALRALRARFRGRKAIVTSHPGRATTANLIALAASGPDHDVQAFLLESAALDWLLEGDELA